MPGYALPTWEWSAFNRRIGDEFGAGWLTRAAKDVALAIARLNFVGETTPTVARIALEAVCSARTVRRARATLQARGILGVTSTYEIVDDRAQQRANRYSLAVPDEPVTPKPRLCRGGPRVRPSEGRKKERGLGRWLDEANRGQGDLLVPARALMDARLAAKWASRRLM